MKVLMVVPVNALNTVVKSYIESLEKVCNLVVSVDLFWTTAEHFDVVHIQWAEALSFNQPSDQDLMERIKQRFLYFKSRGTRIVITRHNEKPHDVLRVNMEVFEYIHKKADAVVHLGKFSLEQFKAGNPDGQLNVVIAHPNYLSTPNQISRKRSRTTLGFNNTDYVFLCFGSLRNKFEEMQILKAFSMLNLPNKKLLITKSSLCKGKVSFRTSPLKRLRYEYNKQRLKIEGVILDENNFIAEDDMQFLFNASDSVICPRLMTLNSGVIFLAFSFGKIVIGPNYGNIGEILKETGNPIFVPGDVESVHNAMIDAFNLKDTNLAEMNLKYAREKCDPTDIANNHLKLYEQILTVRASSRNLEL